MKKKNKSVEKDKKKILSTKHADHNTDSKKVSTRKKTNKQQEPEDHSHETHPAKGFVSIYYSRVKRERGSGMYGGQGYTSRGGYGRRG